jgi:hypothetical protein
MADLEKILRVFKSKNVLAQFHAALPKTIAALKGRPLSDMHGRLDALRAHHPHAVPFALYMIVRRLTQPWQLIRLATHDAHGVEATDIAATPYAYAFPVVLGTLNDRRIKLLSELRQNHVLMARDILSGIYELERTLRIRVGHLEGTDWGRQLDRLMELVRNELEAELHKLPDNLHHVLGSPALHRRTGIGGELSRLMWRLRGTAWSLAPALLHRGRDAPEGSVGAVEPGVRPSA